MAVDRREGVTPGNSFYKHFRDSGGSEDMTVDGSSTAVSFFVEGVADAETHIARVMLITADAAISMVTFSGMAALSTGMTIKVLDTDGVVLLDYLDGDTMKKNLDWVHIAGIDGTSIDTKGAGDDVFMMRWTILKGGHPLRLFPGQKLEALVQDDLDTGGPTELVMTAQGYTIPIYK